MAHSAILAADRSVKSPHCAKHGSAMGCGGQQPITSAATAALAFQAGIGSSAFSTAMTAVDRFTPLIGGIPIIIDGQVVGGAGVSGAASVSH